MSHRVPDNGFINKDVVILNHPTMTVHKTHKGQQGKLVNIAPPMATVRLLSNETTQQFSLFHMRLVDGTERVGDLMGLRNPSVPNTPGPPHSYGPASFPAHTLVSGPTPGYSPIVRPPPSINLPAVPVPAVLISSLASISPTPPTLPAASVSSTAHISPPAPVLSSAPTSPPAPVSPAASAPFAQSASSTSSASPVPVTVANPSPAAPAPSIPAPGSSIPLFAPIPTDLAASAAPTPASNANANANTDAVKRRRSQSPEVKIFTYFESNKKARLEEREELEELEVGGKRIDKVIIPHPLVGKRERGNREPTPEPIVDAETGETVPEVRKKARMRSRRIVKAPSPEAPATDASVDALVTASGSLPTVTEASAETPSATIEQSTTVNVAQFGPDNSAASNSSAEATGSNGESLIVAAPEEEDELEKDIRAILNQDEVVIEDPTLLAQMQAYQAEHPDIVLPSVEQEEESDTYQGVDDPLWEFIIPNDRTASVGVSPADLADDSESEPESDDDIVDDYDPYDHDYGSGFEPYSRHRRSSFSDEHVFDRSDDEEDEEEYVEDMEWNGYDEESPVDDMKTELPVSDHLMNPRLLDPEIFAEPKDEMDVDGVAEPEDETDMDGVAEPQEAMEVDGIAQYEDEIEVNGFTQPSAEEIEMDEEQDEGELVGELPGLSISSELSSKPSWNTDLEMEDGESALTVEKPMAQDVVMEESEVATAEPPVVSVPARDLEMADVQEVVAGPPTITLRNDPMPVSPVLQQIELQSQVPHGQRPLPQFVFAPVVVASQQQTVHKTPTEEAVFEHVAAVVPEEAVPEALVHVQIPEIVIVAPADEKVPDLAEVAEGATVQPSSEAHIEAPTTAEEQVGSRVEAPAQKPAYDAAHEPVSEEEVEDDELTCNILAAFKAEDDAAIVVEESVQPPVQEPIKDIIQEPAHDVALESFFEEENGELARELMPEFEAEATAVPLTEDPVQELIHEPAENAVQESADDTLDSLFDEDDDLARDIMAAFEAEATVDPLPEIPAQETIQEPLEDAVEEAADETTDSLFGEDYEDDLERDMLAAFAKLERTEPFVEEPAQELASRPIEDVEVTVEEGTHEPFQDSIAEPVSESIAEPVADSNEDLVKHPVEDSALTSVEEFVQDIVETAAVKIEEPEYVPSWKRPLEEGIHSGAYVPAWKRPMERIPRTPRSHRKVRKYAEDDFRNIWADADDATREEELQEEPQPEPEPEPQEGDPQDTALIVYDIEGVQLKPPNDMFGLQYLFFFLSTMMEFVVAPACIAMMEVIVPPALEFGSVLGHYLTIACVYLFFRLYSGMLLQFGRPLPSYVAPRDARRILLARQIPQFHNQICRWVNYTELEIAYAEHYANRLPFKATPHLPFHDPRIAVHLELVELVNNPRSLEGERFILLVKQLCALDRIHELTRAARDAVFNVEPHSESIRIALWRLGNSIMAFYRLSPSMKACGYLSPFVHYNNSVSTYQSLWNFARFDHPTIFDIMHPSFRLISPAIIHLQSFAAPLRPTPDDL